MIPSVGLAAALSLSAAAGSGPQVLTRECDVDTALTV